MPSSLGSGSQTAQILNMNALKAFKMSQNTRPVTHCHIPEDLDLQQICSENYKSHKINLVTAHM